MLEKKKLLLSKQRSKTWISVYSDAEVKTKAYLLYFHGGGLLFGNREDLPDLHIRTMTQAGYAIVSFDYPLAPAVGVDSICSDVWESIHAFLKITEHDAGTAPPFFLWGRSAGAYLCLLAAVSGQIPLPLGVISYYGYGLLCDGWFHTPSTYYCTLPPVDECCLKQYYENDSPDARYSIYIYGRQTGKWMSLIYGGSEKQFYLSYTLRTSTTFPCPLFCTHSINDHDVPYSEFMALADRFSPTRFITAGKNHDFDRDEAAPATSRLLMATIAFLDQQTASNRV